MAINLSGINISGGGSATSGKLKMIPVSELPEPSAASKNAMYLVPSAHPTGENKYDEYTVIDTPDGPAWEIFGRDVAIDLSGYATSWELTKKQDKIQWMNEDENAVFFEPLKDIVLVGKEALLQIGDVVKVNGKMTDHTGSRFTTLNDIKWTGNLGRIGSMFDVSYIPLSWCEGDTITFDTNHSVFGVGRRQSTLKVFELKDKKILTNSPYLFGRLYNDTILDETNENGASEPVAFALMMNGEYIGPDDNMTFVRYHELVASGVTFQVQVFANDFYAKDNSPFSLLPNTENDIIRKVEDEQAEAMLFNSLYREIGGVRKELESKSDKAFKEDLRALSIFPYTGNASNIPSSSSIALNLAKMKFERLEDAGYEEKELPVLSPEYMFSADVSDGSVTIYAVASNFYPLGLTINFKQDGKLIKPTFALTIDKKGCGFAIAAISMPRPVFETCNQFECSVQHQGKPAPTKTIYVSDFI